ncbi:holo-ACP synthase [Pediococcus stilesii]|uniref:Holo-[acyl-carrier-protein] synthase n=1 Tax=Pediococcus stilesii TaxID=331679 RepID=A0A0R2L3D3_9LACO|nr:holo-ACP synthase [Pediococcus stilesii]KRN93754.1 phosphopantetheinyl transferase (holo-ACP synthase) [Pediococcus stilesii]TLQ04753.1 holo-ACP synthase [Pediococcus stilesii]
MIYGIGIDITNIDRFRTLHNPETFISRVLTPNEFAEWKSKKGQRAYEFLAGRFSVKESYSKAYGTGLGKKLNFQDIEIDYDETGKPIITKHPFDGIVHVSISHSDHHVVTQVILEGDK